MNGSNDNNELNEVIAEKKELRAKYLALRSQLSDDVRKEKDARLFETLTSLACFKTADTLLAYYPVRGEVGLISIVEEALRLGKKVAFPISDKESLTLDFRIISSLSELKEGGYDIPEPPKTAKKLTNTATALCIVPALAFDRDGFRLGYGKGYYDRFLAGFDGITVGLAYSEFLADEVPALENDVRVDLIITEKEVHAPDVF